MKLYSYVVDHDTGFAPNPYDGLCTLCRCKFRKRPVGKRNVVEMAEKGDWIVGTGGASKRSAGHGKLVYAMQVDEKLTREEYYNRCDLRKRVDNIRPRNDFEKNGQFALVSKHFYYFGKDAIEIPENFKLEKSGPGYRCDFGQAEIKEIVEWLEGQNRQGKCGEPCAPRSAEKPKESRKCRSPC